MSSQLTILVLTPLSLPSVLSCKAGILYLERVRDKGEESTYKRGPRWYLVYLTIFLPFCFDQAEVRWK